MTIRWYPRLGFWRLGDEDQLGDIENLRAPLADRPRTVHPAQLKLSLKLSVRFSTQLSLPLTRDDER